MIEFVGVKINNQDSEIIPNIYLNDKGIIDLNIIPTTTIYTIGNEFDKNTNNTIAKFSRPLKQRDLINGLDLSGCIVKKIFIF